jgi:hemerythrin
MAFAWDDSLETGVAEIDDAHKTLFLWVNKLSDAMSAGKANAEVLSVLNFLGIYAQRHFAHEENCMNRYKCPAAEVNKKAHAEFLVYFTKMKQEAETNGVTTKTVLELQLALGNWLRNHIKKVDVSLRPCVGK